MKRLMLISFLASLALAACGQKDNIGLRARSNGNGQPVGGANNKPVQGAFNAPPGSESKVMTDKSVSSRNVMIQKTSVRTSILCSEDLIASATQDSLIHMAYGSQIVIGQDKENQIPDQRRQTIDPRRQKTAATIKDVLTLSCKTSTPTAATPDATSASATLIKMITDQSNSFDAKVDAANKDKVLKLAIKCMAKDKMGEADKSLLQVAATGVDLVLAEGSTILFPGQDSDNHDSLTMVTCQPDPNAKIPVKQNDKKDLSPEDTLPLK
jgi:hypothetical protein